MTRSSDAILDMFNNDFPTYRVTKFDAENFLAFYLENRSCAPDMLKNKHVTSDLIANVIDTATEEELWWIATKKCLSNAQITMLANDSRPEIRQRIAYHKKTSPELLRVLSNDDDELVRSAAMQRLAD